MGAWRPELPGEDVRSNVANFIIDLLESSDRAQRHVICEQFGAAFILWALTIESSSDTPKCAPLTITELMLETALWVRQRHRDGDPASQSAHQCDADRMPPCSYLDAFVAGEGLALLLTLSGNDDEHIARTSRRLLRVCADLGL